MGIDGIENSQKVRMIYLDDKTETIFKSIAYAVRVTGVPEYSIRTGLSPLAKKRFDVNGRKVCFRIHK